MKIVAQHPQPSVIFSTSGETLYEHYTPNMIPFSDAKLHISFETSEMMEETLILLRCVASACCTQL